MENMNPEELQRMIEQGVKGLPMPPTFKIPKTIDDVNQYGSTFSQTNIQWMWSQLASFIAVANSMSGSGKEIMSEFKEMSSHVQQLFSSYREDIAENRNTHKLIIQRNCHLEEERGDMIAGDLEFKRDIKRDAALFEKAMQDRFDVTVRWIIGIVLVGNVLGPIAVLLMKSLLKL